MMALNCNCDTVGKETEDSPLTAFTVPQVVKKERIAAFLNNFSVDKQKLRHQHK